MTGERNRQAVVVPAMRATVTDATDLAVEVEAVDATEVRDWWSQAAMASGNVFATPEFIESWHRWAGQPPLRAVTVTTPGRGLVGMLLLVEDRRGPLRMLRFAGHGPGDLLGPVGAAADLPLLAVGLRTYLEQATGFDLFVGERLLGAHDWARTLGGVEIGREGFPIARLDPAGGWDGYLARRGRRLRKELRRDERALHDGAPMRFRTTEDAARLDEDLATFLRLHERRWGSGTSSLLGMASFLRSFATEAFERGWLRLTFLDVDGRTVAARFDLSYGGVYGAVNSGRDPAFEQAGVGRIIRGETMRRALEEGVTEYRFLRGGEAYKYRFADEDPEVVTVARSSTPLGAATLLGLQLARRAGVLRRLVRRLA